MNSLLETSGKEYTIEHLRKLLHPESDEWLALLLSEMKALDLVDKVLRVESSQGRGGIADFASILDVPEVLHDWRTDREVDVTPDDIRLIFRFHGQP